MAMNKYYYDSQVGSTATPRRQIHKHKLPLTDSAMELTQTINRSHEILIQATTVFPFTLFPDTVTLDRAKLTIAHREFFWVAEVMSIRIEDILNVTADVGPFFGSLKIFTRFFATDRPYTVSFLRRSDALRIKRILQGYIIALQKNIDCSSMPTKELAGMLDELGF